MFLGSNKTGKFITTFSKTLLWRYSVCPGEEIVLVALYPTFRLAKQQDKQITVRNVEVQFTEQETSGVPYVLLAIRASYMHRLFAVQSLG